MRPQTTWGRAGQYLQRAAVLYMVAAFTVAVPVGLVHYTGWPLPRHVPAWSQLPAAIMASLTETGVARILACGVWLAWLAFAVCLATEVTATLSGYPAPRLPGLAPAQALASALAGALTLTAVTLPGLDASLLPPPTVAPVAGTLTLPSRPEMLPHTASRLSVRSTVAQAHAVREEPRDTPSLAGRRSYQVAAGDNLWDIAQRYLGNPERWPEIFALNQGLPQPDGRVLTDPAVIYPGWILLLPPRHACPPRHAKAAHPAPFPPPGHAPQGRHRRPVPSGPAGRGANSGAPRPEHGGRAAQRGGAPGTHPSHSRPLSPVPSPPEHHNGAIALPSGKIIGLSLAIATGLAIVTARVHRRRHREPAPVPGSAPAEEPLPPTLRHIRQAHLTTASQQISDENADSAAHLSAAAPARATDDDIPPRLGASMETINVAVHDDEEIRLDLACMPGIGLAGPGAADAIRAIIITLLARRARDQAEVLLCGEDACRLLATDRGPNTEVPGLAAFSNADDGLSRLEAMIIHRRRLLDAVGGGDLAAYRDANPDEDLPTVLAVAPAVSPHARRLAAVLGLGQRLGITGILIGSWPAGATCEIAADGQVTGASAGELSYLTGTQMFQLTLDDAADVLTTLAAAAGSTPSHGQAGPPRPLPMPEAEPSIPAAADRIVQLSVLGPFHLMAAGQPITKGLRRKAAELLTYLTIYRDGATTEAILDALWPETPADRAAVILHAATSNIRKLLRDTTRAPESGFIIRAAGHLRIDAHMIDTDLWRFQDALARAAHAPTDHERRASLQAAAELWSGDLVPGIDSIWIDEHRETLRRDAVDTLARLAEFCAHDDPDQALAYLERAVTIDRYQEPLYRRIMRLQGNLGRPDAARRTYQLLESRLTSIDAEPGEITAQLLNEVLHPRGARSVAVVSEDQ